MDNWAFFKRLSHLRPEMGSLSLASSSYLDEVPRQWELQGLNPSTHLDEMVSRWFIPNPSSIGYLGAQEPMPIKYANAMLQN